MNRAFIFPGQGSQAVGMGKDFFDTEPVAKDVFNQVNDFLGYKLTDIIFYDKNNELSITNYTQPAIMVTSVAILATLLHKTGKKISQLCDIVAGHSLGEYSALYAAEFMNLEQVSKLLQIRSGAMHKASLNSQSAMAACMGVDPIDLQNIIDLNVKNGVCQIANDNTDGQVVISGHTSNIDMIIAQLKLKKYRAIKLNVSAAFHSKLMHNAESEMNEALSKENFSVPEVPVICNVNASLETNKNSIKENLVRQICSRVRWRETMDQFAKKGITELVEIGPGKVLSNLAKKSKHEFVIHNIATIEDMYNFIEK